ncbi:MAG: hypothetical protein WAW61_22485 [Methylococcaceae bacterium]
MKKSILAVLLATKSENVTSKAFILSSMKITSIKSFDSALRILIKTGSIKESISHVDGNKIYSI